VPNELSVLELLRQGSDKAHSQLRQRGVLRSAARNPTGDYAEWLVAKQLGAERAVQSQLGYDLLQADGVRVQVKGRRMSGGPPPQKFGTLYQLEAREFDFVAAVLLEVDWTVREAWWVPWEAVSRVARWSERRHHWRLNVSGRWKSDAAVSTLDLRLAEGEALRPLDDPERDSTSRAAPPAVPPKGARPRVAPRSSSQVSESKPDAIRALIRQYSDGDRGVAAELRRRGVFEGTPAWAAGDYAHYLVARHLGGRHVSESGYGVVADGQRLQVRGRHRKTHRDPTYFAVDLKPDSEQLFDALVAVLFETDFTLSGAWMIPWKIVPRVAVKYRRTGYRLMVGGRWRDDPEVVALPLA